VRLKLDENLPRDLADELARRGHDVDTVLDGEHLGGRKDPVVVQAATDDERLVITLDRG
jgi:predicted nuclease of predicted toxin-antitoxin system